MLSRDHSPLHRLRDFSIPWELCQSKLGTVLLAACSTVHKAAGLTVPGHSITLPGTIPENGAGGWNGL